MSRMVDGLETIDMIMAWWLCPYCDTEGREPHDNEVYLTKDCPECLGTDLDTIPWAELFRHGRIRR